MKHLPGCKSDEKSDQVKDRRVASWTFFSGHEHEGKYSGDFYTIVSRVAEDKNKLGFDSSLDFYCLNAVSRVWDCVPNRRAQSS